MKEMNDSTFTIDVSKTQEEAQDLAKQISGEFESCHILAFAGYGDDTFESSFSSIVDVVAGGNKEAIDKLSSEIKEFWASNWSEETRKTLLTGLMDAVNKREPEGDQINFAQIVHYIGSDTTNETIEHWIYETVSEVDPVTKSDILSLCEGFVFTNEE
ncbi:hypothetical protein [Vibrio sp. D431a]|uniref:hypothetical protein n=1 Tax=Vibrio sp. D431a TaxID=2837388 RepID=UPI002554CCEB|nr:hypothetical protein [Vibrio sp. D431a]MDK9793763.1 hypothetical protein [Vibrio sp. D431a]